MGKKRRSSQNSNNPINHGDSSESEDGSKDSSQVTEAVKTSCTHFMKSAEISTLRKNMKTNKEDYLLCGLCKKKNISNECQDGWVCLQCASYNCGPSDPDHRTEHFNTPRSDSHCLAYQITTNSIWCFKCEQEIPVDINKKVQSCIDLIKKQCNGYSTNEPNKNETDNRTVVTDDASSFLKKDTLNSLPLPNTLDNKVAKVNNNLPKVRGLMNLGNTCFFNSVLQCLAQTPDLVALLEEMDIPGEKFHLELDGITIDAVLEKHKSSEVSEHLAAVLKEVAGAGSQEGENLRYHPVNPRSLLRALTNKCPQFEGGDQHDSHELLRHLLDSVYKEDLKRYQSAILEYIGYKRKTSLDDLDEDSKNLGKKLNLKVCDSILIRPEHLFKGSLVSILQCCECKHISTREETFLDLSLPVALEKAQPPGIRRRLSTSVDQLHTSPSEEKEAIESKHKKKYKRTYKRPNSIQKMRYDKFNLDKAEAEPTIEEEIKKDSVDVEPIDVDVERIDADVEPIDADVEDNVETAFDEPYPKTEVVESGYSSEKQMSTRASPVTTRSTDDHGSNVNKPLTDLSELSITVPREGNLDCKSHESIPVNASKDASDLSSDSQLENNSKNIDLPLPLVGSDDNKDLRKDYVLEWACCPIIYSESNNQESSTSLSPQCSNDNMSVCDSIPENVPLVMNSSNNSKEEKSFGSDERLDCISVDQKSGPVLESGCDNLLKEKYIDDNELTKDVNVKNSSPGSEEVWDQLDSDCPTKLSSGIEKSRCSPVEPGVITELDDSLCSMLKLSLEEVACAGDKESPVPIEEPVYNDLSQNSFVLIGGVTSDKAAIPLPPPSPPTVLFAAPYQFTHPEPAMAVNNGLYSKNKEEACSLQSCLSQFITTEMLYGDNKVGCEACTEKMNKGNKEGKTVYQNSSKQLLICKLPKIVIFHLKRFQVHRCSFRKISLHVDFPLILDISPFCSKNESERGPILYSLYGVVEHSGTLQGGHYVAYVKVRTSTTNSNSPGKWFYISDSRVSGIEESEVLTKQAYLLFYERIL